MRNHFRFAVFFAATCLIAWGQAVSTSQIKGTVHDPSGLAIPDAAVKVTQTDTGAVRTAATGADGAYVLPNLPIGPYRLEVSKDGFAPYRQDGIVLQVDSNPTIDVAVKVGSVSEQVVVQADAAMVETRSSGVGQVVDQQRIVDLPLNGRQATQLIFLAGAASTGYNRDINTVKNYPEATISVAGGQSGGMTYLMDGGTYNDPMSNLNLPLPFPDALQEFKVETSALPAQYGQHSAAAVNVVTKSGGNEFHGNAFDFVRNGDFNARDFFAATRDSLKRNQLGGTFGGPIKKNKLFFFVGFQYTIQRSDPNSNITFDPTAAMLGGDFTAFASPACNGNRQITLAAPFANNMLAPSLFNPAGFKLASSLPVSFNPCGRVTYGLANNQTEPQGLAKVDYQIGNHSIFGRYFATHLLIPTPDATANPLLSQGMASNDLDQSAVLGDTWVIGPGTVSAFRADLTRTAVQRVGIPTYTPVDLGVNMYVVTSVPPYTGATISGGPNIGGSGNAAQGFFPSVGYQFAEDFNLVRGAHQISFGANFIHTELNTASFVNANGAFGFTGQATGLGYGDLFAGISDTFKQGNPSIWQPRQFYTGLYVQDAWRATSHLTLSAGVRWDPFFAESQPLNRTSNFEPGWFAQGLQSSVYTNAPAGVFFPGEKLPNGSTLPSGGYFGKKADFAPRLGVVWDPRGDGRMTVRAAYGIFYDLSQLFWANAIQNSPPWGSSISLNNVNFSNPWATYPGGNPFPLQVPSNATFALAGSYANMPLHPNPTYMQQWNLTIQKQLGSSWLLSAGYLGNQTVHMWVVYDENPAVYMPGASCTINGKVYTPCSSTTNTNQRRLLYLLNPAQGQYFSSINQLDDGGTQSYNGMLLSAQHRLSNNFTILANYTWSHCIGDSQADELTAVTYLQAGNRKADRGDCYVVDRRQILNISAVGQMPKFSDRWLRILASGWQLSTIVSAQTGPALNIVTGIDNALTGQSQLIGQRPNQVLSNVYCANRTVNCWFNTAAFSQPATGTYGNLGADNVIGPGMLEVDAGLSRIFQIREKHRLEFRVEAFNILNRLNGSLAAAPGAASVSNLTLNNGAFGTIQSDSGPRILQLALKYAF
jgi:Carboxypeptidase regulatory-like domain